MWPARRCVTRLLAAARKPRRRPQSHRRQTMDDVQIKNMVRARYGSIAAANEASCCAPASSSCGGPEATPQEKARRMGYSEAELAAIPDVANLGLGCGNPQAIAAMQP